jgi:LmbE family N-acetylglucosaminyl deacetylase
MFRVALFGLVHAMQRMSPVGDSTVALNFSAWTGKSVMMVGAHPDDIEAGAGGLVSMLTAQNTQVIYVITTNGDKGCGAPFCQNYTSVQIASVRYGEALDAAAIVGVPSSHVVMLDYEDGMMTSYPESQVREELVGTIRKWQPSAIMTWYPYMRFDLQPSKWDDLGYHPDHQCTARIAIDAAFDAGVGLLFPLAGSAWQVRELYVWEFGRQVTHYVDIGKALDVKARAFAAHRSQYSGDTATEVKMLAQGVAANLVGVPPSIQYAEGFLSFV